MDGLSWRAKLGTSNITILNINRDDPTRWDVYYEFMYHPHSGVTKWCKTWTTVQGQYSEGLDEQLPVVDLDLLDQLEDEVLKLRKELEA